MKESFFRLGTVLSVTSDRLLCEITDVYMLLSFMTDDDIYTHQIPLACEICKPAILEQYPDLAKFDASTITPENWRDELSKAVEIFGPGMTISALPPEQWTHINPLEEAKAMFGDDKVIAVSPDKVE